MLKELLATALISLGTSGALNNDAPSLALRTNNLNYSWDLSEYETLRTSTEDAIYKDYYQNNVLALKEKKIYNKVVYNVNEEEVNFNATLYYTQTKVAIQRNAEVEDYRIDDFIYFFATSKQQIMTIYESLNYHLIYTTGSDEDIHSCYENSYSGLLYENNINTYINAITYEQWLTYQGYEQLNNEFILNYYEDVDTYREYDLDHDFTYNHEEYEVSTATTQYIILIRISTIKNYIWNSIQPHNNTKTTSLNYNSIEYGIDAVNTQIIQVTEVVDLPGFVFTILGMPFTFISTAFNLTLFPNTPYALNVSNLILSIVALLVFIFLVKLFMGKS